LNQSRYILGVRVDATSYARATDQILDWAARHLSRLVCCASVNNIMAARDSAEFKKVMDSADLVTSDGMPLVWLLRCMGIREAQRVYGPDLMPAVLESAAESGVPVGLYGGSPEVLRRLVERLTTRFPKLDIAYAESPPYRPPTQEEDEGTTQAIAKAGVRILFIGLSTPKQERWMYSHRGRVDAVMLGVGAAFDFLAGAKPQAPSWMQRNGLEWLFRLATEPRRLWKRYLGQNPRFAVLALAQVLRERLS
jgi:N-acetylglucosaminyldiphosphoundecaprenol N-acetyl-beta-D-mannosaminyltransferase